MKKISCFIVFLIIALYLVVLSCSDTITNATITRVYQPLVSGPVNTYIEVTFEDGKTADVILPVDDKIWNTASRSKGKQVKLKKSGEKWLFVDFSAN